MTTAALIVAAGSGRRLGGEVPKQYRLLAGEPMLRRTVRGALACGTIDRVTVAIHPDWRAEYDAAVAPLRCDRLTEPVDGGDERSDTVRRGLDAMGGYGAPDVVLIHDAARPFATPDLWSRLAAATGEREGAIPALAVADALWSGETHAEESRPRDGLWRAQTPQAFPFALIRAAHRAAKGGPSALDDAEVFRRMGHRVKLIGGEPGNAKITTAADLAEAEARLSHEGPMDIRTGHGFDVHVFEPGDHVMLCGVRVPHDHGLKGHSDADVGLHALADAIYGALAEGDIGTHFPPSDPQWKNAESHVFLAHAAERVRKRGGRIANVDVTLLAERPKVGPHAEAMRAQVAAILGIGTDRVGIKATTMERMGAIGREEGMGCMATATVIL